MQPRPYQLQAHDAVKAEWDAGRRKTLLVLPTGTGKTIVFCMLSETMVRLGCRILILAHRGELLDQAADKMRQVTGLGCCVEKAEQSAFDEWYRITVGSVQTMMRESRLQKFPHDYFDVIIVDEAHHALAETYQRILNHFPNAKVLGVTATPDRGDMRSLGQYFDSIAYSYPLPKAIKDGYLSRIVARTIPINIDLDNAKIPIYGPDGVDKDIFDMPVKQKVVAYRHGVRQTSGDFNASDIDSVITPYLKQIVEEMKTHCADRKTLVFLPLIRTSQHMRDLLEEAGFRACEVNGDSKDRKEVIDAFAEGKYNVCCNSMLLTEGFDCPSVDCVICLRPTKIRSLYCQIVGRGTRPFPGKKNLLLLDFLWMSQKHDLCRPAYLLAENEHQAAAATKKINEAGADVDLEQMQIVAEQEEIHEREAALLKELNRLKKKRGTVTDPVEFAMQIHDESLAKYEPKGLFEQQPASLDQLQKLIQAGIDATKITSTGQADAFLDVLDKRRSLASPNTVKKLKSYGFRHVETWSKEAAQKMITRLALNCWRVPRNVDPASYRP